jgi:hypothetical protein
MHARVMGRLGHGAGKRSARQGDTMYVSLTIQPPESRHQARLARRVEHYDDDNTGLARVPGFRSWGLSYLR